MKFLKNAILFLLIAIIPLMTSCAPNDFLTYARTDKVGIDSKVLDMMLEVEIHLPPGYDSNEPIPALYLLHDYAVDESSIGRVGFFNMADILVEQGLIEPMLIVAPQINNSYLLNSSEKTMIYGDDGITGLYSGMFEDYFINEVIEYIESTYNVSTSPDNRYLGGISTGGFSALRMAFSHPDMFSKVGAHMPAMVVPEMTMTGEQFMDWYYPDEAAAKERNPIELASAGVPDGLSIFLDCGDEDVYSKPFADGLADVLAGNNITFDYQIYTGTHNNEYLSEHITDYLMFYGGK